MNNIRNQLLDCIEEQTENITDGFYKELLELVSQIQPPREYKSYKITLLSILPFVCKTGDREDEDPEDDNRYIGTNIDKITFDLQLTTETIKILKDNIGCIFNTGFGYFTEVPKEDYNQLTNIYKALTIRNHRDNTNIDDTTYEIPKTFIIFRIETE